MALQAPTTNNTKKFAAQPNLEPGAYPARVARVYGLGEHPQSYKGEAKGTAQEIWVIYELVDAFMVDENGDEIEGKPRWVQERFPLRSLMADNAKSTKRINALDPQGKLKGDWSKVIGLPVMVTVVTGEGKDGRLFDNVGSTSVARPRDVDRMPDLVNEGFFFDPSEPELEYYNQIPGFLQDVIKGSIGFTGSKLEAIIGGEATAPKKSKEAPAPEPEVEEDTDNNPWD